MRVAGVDGCKTGWLAVSWDDEARALAPSFHPTIAELVAALPDLAAYGIDIPIGLKGGGEPRACDVEARRLLRFPRRNSVFPAPDRGWLERAAYAEANDAARELAGKGISQQAFNIGPKVREVDLLLRARPELRERFAEVHPELSFWALNGGRAMIHAKRKQSGFDERRALLASVFPADQLPASREHARALAPHAAPDDLLDAIAAAWSAARYATGTARIIGDEVDTFGLPMRIVA